MNELSMMPLKNPATNSVLGKTAILFEPGEDPVEVIITKIDQASGLIIEVVIKNDELEKKVLDVKNKVVVFLPWIIRLIMSLIDFFKRKKTPASK